METRYGIGLNHDLANNRMASVGNISFFSPYAFLEGTIGYFSSGAGNPNEFYFSKGGRCFDVSAASRLIYSNNGVNHIYIDGDDTANNLINFAAVYENSMMEFKTQPPLYTIEVAKPTSHLLVLVRLRFTLLSVLQLLTPTLAPMYSLEKRV